MYKLSDITNTVIEGNSVEILKRIPDKSVDLIFADPPYWMQTEGILRRTDGSSFNGVQDDWDKFGSFSEYDEFTLKWLTQCMRVLKDDGALWAIGSFQNIYRLGYIMQNLGFWILNDIIWSKPNAVPNFSGTRFQNSHETLIWCSKRRGSKYRFNYKTMKHLNGQRQDKSIWDIGICIGAERLKDENGKKVHSTQKPEKLLYKVILSTTKPGDIVLDPFFGTGTTGAVAKRIGRNFIGIERSNTYVKVARDRITKVTSAPSDIELLSLEVKPPRVSVSKLIASGYLTVGERLYNKNGDSMCVLTADGKVSDGADVLSIHKMSAKLLNVVNHNGWGYFYVMRDGKLMSINQFRYEFVDAGGCE